MVGRMGQRKGGFVVEEGGDGPRGKAKHEEL